MGEVSGVQLAAAFFRGAVSAWGILHQFGGLAGAAHGFGLAPHVVAQLAGINGDGLKISPGERRGLPRAGGRTWPGAKGSVLGRLNNCRNTSFMGWLSWGAVEALVALRFRRPGCCAGAGRGGVF